MNYSRDFLLKDFDNEIRRCNNYFDYMYKTIQFTFAAIIALMVFMFGNNVSNESAHIIFTLVAPTCLYVFGILYAYNAYALAVCGAREEHIHLLLSMDSLNVQNTQSKIVIDESDFDVLSKHVVTDRRLALIYYGVPLGCFLVAPIGSILLGISHTSSYGCFITYFLPWFLYSLYIFLMTILLVNISKNHFKIKDLQNKRKLDTANK